MIADIKVLKCPFLKRHVVDNGFVTNSGKFIPHYQDEFGNCIEKECMAWNQKEKSCLLMRKNEKPEQ